LLIWMDILWNLRWLREENEMLKKLDFSAHFASLENMNEPNARQCFATVDRFSTEIQQTENKFHAGLVFDVKVLL